MSAYPSETAILWRDWDDQAFRAARSEGKPVLLALTATWCHWCHVMDRTTYSEPRVIDVVNTWFIPVRVDVDQRPDLAARYNQGGYPSVAFLNGDGELIAGRVYTPPDEMVRLLEQLRSSYPEGVVLHPSAATESNRYPPLLAKGPGATARLVRQGLEELYDHEFGGFGNEPKQPPWEGVELLLALYQRDGERRILEMACQTLEGILNGLCDYKDGGFFRYSVSRDWRVPHYEKMLVTNAQLASSLLSAFQVTGKQVYRKAAMGTLNYLISNLKDPVSGLFWASQDAGEEYYRLPWKDRKTAVKPSIDTALYTGWNALAATALVRAFGVLAEPSYLKRAGQVLEALWAGFGGASRGLAHVAGEPPERPRFLSDHVLILSASLNFYQATGDGTHLQRSEWLVDSIQRLFAASDGGFYDANSGNATAGPSLPKVKPVLDNALLAEALVTLATLTGVGAYLETAKATLETFTGVVPGRSYLGPPGARRMEDDEERLCLPAASAWARAWDIVESGAVHLVVVGDVSHRATKSLVRASLRARRPWWVIQLLDPAKDRATLVRLGFPADGVPTAYLCTGGACLAPIHSAAELRRWTKRRNSAFLAVSGVKGV